MALKRDPGATAQPSNFATFLIVWAGQFMSLIGSGLTSFGLGVWVYQRTGSATQFAVISVLFLAPQVIVTVLGGVLADRYSRRQIMLACNAVAGLVSASLVVTLAVHRLDLRLVYLATFLFGVCNAVLYPAFSTSVALLAPQAQLGRANGLVQLAASGSRVIAPLAAAYLLAIIGLGGIIAIDTTSFLAAIASLVLVDVPQPKRVDTATGPLAVLQDIHSGWRYIAVRPGLLGLLGFFFILNLSAAPVYALLSPLVLRFARPVDLGLVSSSGGAAFLLAGLLMSGWGGPARRIHAVLPVGLSMGVSMVLLGVQASVPLVAVAAFVFAFGQPVVNAANATLWQTKVPPGLQGRVLALLRMSAWRAGPVALLVCGPPADRVFEPLLQPKAALAGSVGRIIGVGPGRGIALLFIVTAVLPIGAAIAGYLWPAVRDVERRLSRCHAI